MQQMSYLCMYNQPSLGEAAQHILVIGISKLEEVSGHGHLLITEWTDFPYNNSIKSTLASFYPIAGYFCGWKFS